MSAVPQMAPIAQFSRSVSRLGAGMRNAELRGEVLQPGGLRRVWRGGGGGGGEAALAAGAAGRQTWGGSRVPEWEREVLRCEAGEISFC